MKTFFKKQTLVLLVLILSGTVKATAQQATPVGYYGMMQAEGNRIVGSKTGEPMQVKGASFFWSNWSGQFWTEAVVDDMVDNWNVELLRAAWGVQDNGTPYSTDHSQLYTVVDRCIERGIYVIIDWHTHGLDLNVQAAKDFWNKVFDERPQYINNDAVIFELFNEPRFESDGGPDWTTCKSVQEDVLSVIRGRGANNHVIIGTPNFSQDVDVASANPIDDSNVSYALHFYVPNHCAPIWNKIPTAMNNGIPLFATEWGFWDLASWSQCGSDDKAGFAREWMNRLDDNMISWASWGISDKVPEQSSLYWDGSFASSWLPTELQNWRETPVPWICEDFEVSSLEIDGQTTLYPGQETELKAYGITTCNRLLQDATWSSNASGGFFSSDTPGEYTVTASAEGFSAEITITVEEINGTIIGDNEVDDAGEPVTQMCTPWYVHLGNDGTAEFNRTQPGVLGTSYAGKLDYSVVLGANDWDNQAGLGINMTSDETGFDISGSTGIAFWYKGPSVELQVGIETMMNNENWDKFHLVVPASDDWVFHVFDWEDFRQYGWSFEDLGPAEFDLSEVTNFIWMRNGSEGETDRLNLDEVYIVGKEFDAPCGFICEDEELVSVSILASAEEILIGETATLDLLTRSSCKTIDLPADAVVEWSNNVQAKQFSSGSPGNFTVSVTVTSGGQEFADQIEISVVEENATLISNSELANGITYMETNWYSFADENSTVSEVQVTAEGARNTSLGAMISYSGVQGASACEEWQSGTNYPIGTVVTYNGNAYTSTNDWNGTAGAPDQAQWGWEPGGDCGSGEIFAGMGFDMKGDASSYDLTGSSGISFYHKGPACQLEIKQSAVTDYAYYMANVPAHSYWTKVELKWTDFAQPADWGTSVPWDASDIVGFQWNKEASDGENDELWIDEVKIEGLIFETPFVSTSMNDAPDNSSELIVFPNPVVSELNISGLPPSCALVEVYSMDGKLLETINIENEESKKLDASCWDKGFYLIRIKMENNTSKCVKVFKVK